MLNNSMISFYGFTTFQDVYHLFYFLISSHEHL